MTTPYIANLSSGSAPVDPLWWQEFGACANADPEIFFPERGGATRAARATCKTCDPGIRAECLAYALLNNEQTGIWGGTSERERRKLRSQAKGNGTSRGYAGRTRTLCPAAPFRDALNALVPSVFPNRHQLAIHVAGHSKVNRRSLADFMGRQSASVTLEWATAVSEALGLPELPAQLWPEETAA
jgi:WhiB family transcriptional regulator, redox-sensing transcriptional regulator